MKDIRIIFLTTCLLVSAGCGDKKAEPGSGDAVGREMKVAIPDDPSAVIINVNGNELTVSQALARADQRLTSLHGELSNAERKRHRPELLNKVLNQFVMRTLLLEEAERVGITVSREETSDEFARLDRSLRRIGKGINEVMAHSSQGEESMREEIVTRLKVRKLLTQQRPDAPPTERDIQAFKRDNQNGVPMPESVSARHILVRVGKDDSEAIHEEKRQKLEHVRRQLIAGADFVQMASEFSDCPTRVKGGQLGSLPRGFMPLAFDIAAFSQEIGAVGNIVRSTAGYHLIIVDKRDPPRLVHPDRLPETHLNAAVKAYLNKKAKDELLIRLQEQATITYAKGVQ
jgi:peptidyl-prolyl cis-trans isomerase C